MQPRPQIPHAGPMHWLDTAALSDDGLTATASRTIHADQPFTRNDYLLRSALIELMAQTAAAGSSMKASRQNKKVHKGVLATIRDFHVTAAPPVGSTVHLTATHEKSLGPLSLAYLEARIDDQLIASARMTFHLVIE
jgi:predicted hotdog family 3-hydroxylacyl-ACP dehydratase